MATLSPEWQAALDLYSLLRDEEVEQEATISTFGELLARLAATGWANTPRLTDQLDLHLDVLPERSVRLHWGGEGRSTVALFSGPGTYPRLDAIEHCSGEFAFDVIEDMVHRAHGRNRLDGLPPEWHIVRPPSGNGRAWKYWFESEEAWLEQPGDTGFYLDPIRDKWERGWLALCRWVPAAFALWDCPCIQDVSLVFQPAELPTRPAWQARAERLSAVARRRCVRADRCLPRSIWDRLPLGLLVSLTDPLAHLDGLFWFYLQEIPNRVRDFKGEEVARPIRDTLHLIRKVAYDDVLGNPFRPFWPDAQLLAANDRAAPTLAAAIAATGDYARMPILGDALEEGGCTHVGVLDHCRHGGPHGPGCFVIDTLLGRF